MEEILGEAGIDQDLEVLACLDEDILGGIGRVERLLLMPLLLRLLLLLLLLLILLLEMLLLMLLKMWLLKLRHQLGLRLAQLVERVRLKIGIH